MSSPRGGVDRTGANRDRETSAPVKEDIMKRVWHKLVAFARDERGTETLEWGLVCGLIIVGAITMIALIGPKVTDMWNDVNNEIPTSE